MVVLKAIQAMRVVQKDIRIEDEILREALGFWIRILVEFGKENPLFLVGLKDGRSEHQLMVEGWEKRPPLSEPGWSELKSEKPLKTGRCVIPYSPVSKHKLWLFL